MNDLSAFQITENRYCPLQKLADHKHDQAKLIVLVTGGFSETCEGQVHSCSRIALFIRPPHLTHSNYFHSNGARCLNVSLKESWLKYLNDNGAMVNKPAELKFADAGFLARKLYTEFHNADNLSPLAIEAILLEIFSKTALKDPRVTPPAWLRRAKEVIHSEFSSSLSLEYIALASGVHSVHLARSFRKHYGITIGEYIRRLRVEAACEMIANTEMSLSEIALEVGFYDQAHFSKHFSRFLNLSPAKFRRLNNPTKQLQRR